MLNNTTLIQNNHYGVLQWRQDIDKISTQSENVLSSDKLQISCRTIAQREIWNRGARVPFI